MLKSRWSICDKNGFLIDSFYSNKYEKCRDGYFSNEYKNSCASAGNCLFGEKDIENA